MIGITACCLYYVRSDKPDASSCNLCLSIHCMLPSVCAVSGIPPCQGWSLAISILDVLSEEQIRLKKLKKQEDDQARTVVVRPNPPHPPGPSHKLTPEQLSMIEKLVAAQQQCNQRSFTDRLKVTVITLTSGNVIRKSGSVGSWGCGWSILGEFKCLRHCICGLTFCE